MKNKHSHPSIHFHGFFPKESLQTSSNQLQHPSSAIWTRILFLGWKEKRAAGALQKVIIDSVSIVHRDNKTGGVSIHRYLYLRNRQGSRDKNSFPVHIPSIQCWLLLYNRSPSKQNHLLPMGGQQHPSNNQGLQWKRFGSNHYPARFSVMI